MEEGIVIDRRKSVDVWTDFPDVYISVENRNDVAQARLNLSQAKRLHELLGKAIDKIREEN
jgi:hypothetical protein